MRTLEMGPFVKAVNDRWQQIVMLSKEATIWQEIERGDFSNLRASINALKDRWYYAKS